MSKFQIVLTQRNKNRLSSRTHTLAQVLRNQGFTLYAPNAYREPSADDRESMGKGCPERIHCPSMEVACAEGILHPRSGEPVLWADIKVQK